MNINDHINYQEIFNELIKEKLAELEQYKYEAEHFMNIINFLDKRKELDFEIDIEECLLIDKGIVFYFFWENPANRNEDFITYQIEYDRILNEFDKCEVSN